MEEGAGYGVVLDPEIMLAQSEDQCSMWDLTDSGTGYGTL